MGRAIFKKALIATTALIGTALLQPAFADNIVVNTPTTTPVTLNNGDSLTVTPTGSITGVPGHAVIVLGVNTGAIKNAGVIVGDDAIRIESSNISGGIFNSGTIDGVFGSIHVIANSTVSGGIVNTGSVKDITLSTTSLSGGFTNTGTITNRFALSTADMSGNIQNSGFIDEFFLVNDQFLPRKNVKGSVINSSGGNINTINIANMKITGAFANGVGSSIGSMALNSNADIVGGIRNEGQIGGISVFSRLSGAIFNEETATIDFINQFGPSDVAKGILNKGQIGYIDLGVSSDLSGGIRNEGTIGVPFSAPISIVSAENTAGGIYNSGTIDGMGTGFAIFLSNSGGPLPITLDGGRVIGDIIDFNQSAGSSDVFIKSDFTTEGGMDVSGLRINNSARFTISAGHTIAVNDMFRSGGSLAFGVASAGSTGFLNVQNGAIDLSGVKVRASVPTGATLNDGDEIQVGDGLLSIIGGPGGVWQSIKDNSPLWNFEMADGTAAAAPTDDTDLFLRVSAGDPLLDSSTAQTAAVAGVLGMLGGSPDPDIQSLLADIAGAATTDGIAGILGTLVPPADGGTQQGAQAFSEASFGVTGDHLDDLSGETGVSTGDPWKALRAWGQVFGQAADQSARGGIGGFDADTAGFTLGVESETLFDRAVAGISLGYGRTKIDNKSATNASNGATDIDSYQLSLYGQSDLGNSVYLRGMAAYAFNSNETARYNVGGPAGPTAVADFDASQYALRLETGRSYAAGYAVLTPSLMANVLHYSPDSYTETGAGGLNLNVRGKDVTIAELGLGVKAKWEYKQDDGSKFLPELHGGYRYDLVGDAVESTSAFTGGGGSFTTTGSSPARSRVNFGAGLTYQTSSSWELHAGYDLDLKEDYHAHAGTLRASLRF